MDASQENKSWKERGLGLLHINRHTETGRGRLILRTDITLKLILNIYILKSLNFEILQEKNIRFIGTEEGVPGMFLLRLKSKEEALSAMDAIESLYDSRY